MGQLPKISKDNNSPVSLNSTNYLLNSIPKSRGLKIAALNVASLPKHLDELTVLMQSAPFDILALNETRLDNTIPNSEMGIEGYDLLRRDRNRNGGGVAFYVKNSLNYM